MGPLKFGIRDHGFFRCLLHYRALIEYISCFFVLY